VSIVDARGNTPAPLTDFEMKWRKKLDDGVVAKAIIELAARRALPLADKIALTEERIKEWYEAWDGNVSVSFSGGKDSTVLLSLVRRLFPEVPAVFCNTGLEYPEITRFVAAHENVTVMRPKKPFHQVIRDHGWPLVSKKVARGIQILRNPSGANQNIWRLYDQGINRRGEAVSGFKVPERWRFLVSAPFECSDLCCTVMKKEPMARYERETGRVQFVGMMASDSKTREKTYLQTGCNSFDSKHPKSTPMAFWTEQDVLEFVDRYKLQIPAVYGRVVKGRRGYATTGVRRTGCVFCGFGLHLDEGPLNRFERMARTHPRLHSYVMDRLGMRGVLQYCRDNAAPTIAEKFRWEARDVQSVHMLPIAAIRRSEGF
jgi:3'-phosphoadenosine 5'-phosphosulfate sulfotransferase (PAPS reductase)/FAD synthetase